MEPGGVILDALIVTIRTSVSLEYLLALRLCCILKYEVQNRVFQLAANEPFFFLPGMVPMPFVSSSFKEVVCRVQVARALYQDAALCRLLHTVLNSDQFRLLPHKFYARTPREFSEEQSQQVFITTYKSNDPSFVSTATTLIETSKGQNALFPRLHFFNVLQDSSAEQNYSRFLQDQTFQWPLWDAQQPTHIELSALRLERFARWDAAGEPDELWDMAETEWGDPDPDPSHLPEDELGNSSGSCVWFFAFLFLGIFVYAELIIYALF
jgi:hypothetical protein